MTNDPSSSWIKVPVIGIIRAMPAATIVKIAEAYQTAGFYNLEVTMNTQGVTEIIATLRTTFPNLNIGAGTICSSSDLDKALNAGAQFIVTPILVKEVVERCVQQNIPIFPGAFTPTEIYQAWSMGATAVKVFPATQLGVRYIKNVLAPLNEIKLVPTGGVTLDNIKDFFEAGAAGVGMGSALLNKELIKAGDFEGLTQHFLKIKKELRPSQNFYLQKR